MFDLMESGSVLISASGKTTYITINSFYPEALQIFMSQNTSRSSHSHFYNEHYKLSLTVRNNHFNVL